MCADFKYYKLLPENPSITDGICYDMEDVQLGGNIRNQARFIDSRSIAVDSEMQIHSDLNGDGELDYFVLSIEPYPFINFDCEYNHCTLFLPDGSNGINKIVAGKTSTLGNTDFYILTKNGQELLMKNTMAKRKPKYRHDDLIYEYKNHLLGLKILLNQRHWFNAISKSMSFNLGISHTWVVNEPTQNPLTWIAGEIPYTDCIIEIERVLSEINSQGSSLSDIAATLKKIQHYDLQGTERTDFFAIEAIPHLSKMGIIEDVTSPLHLCATGNNAPVFEYRVDKYSWYTNCKSENPGKDISVWQGELSYYPFEELLEKDNNGLLRFKPVIYDQLEPIMIFAVMNRNRFFKACETEIPTSHTGFLVKKDGDIYIFHSTPTTDMGLTSVTYETVDSFFKTRYVDSTDKFENIILKDPTAVGLKLIQIIRT